MKRSSSNNTQELSRKEKQKHYRETYRKVNEEKVKAHEREFARAYRAAKKQEKAAQNKASEEANKERKAARDKANKEKKAVRDKAYREANKEKVKDRERAYSKAHYEANKERRAASNKAWRESKNNKEKLYAARRARYARDPLSKIKELLRGAVYKTFARLKQSKPTDTQSCLGCTYEEAKAHFESLFRENMSWSNYGEWHVDHIRPVASFGSDELDQMNHISNLQPLWAKDNLIKGDTWEG